MGTLNVSNMREFPKKYIPTKLLMTHYPMATDQLWNLPAGRLLWYMINHMGFIYPFRSLGKNAGVVMVFSHSRLCSWGLPSGNRLMAGIECLTILGKTMSN